MTNLTRECEPRYTSPPETRVQRRCTTNFPKKGTGRLHKRPDWPEIMNNGTVPQYCVLCGMILPDVPELILHLDYEHTFWTQQYVERCEKAELASPANKFLVAELINVEGMA